MSQTLAEIIRRANSALIRDGQLERIERFFTTDYAVHASDRDVGGGPRFVRSHLESLRRTFEDLHVDVEILVEGEDRIAWQRTFRGTQRGAYQGFPATGREITWRDMVTSRFVEGKIAEEWVVSDLAEQLLRARKRTG